MGKNTVANMGTLEGRQLIAGVGKLDLERSYYGCICMVDCMNTQYEDEVGAGVRHIVLFQGPCYYLHHYLPPGKCGESNSGGRKCVQDVNGGLLKVKTLCVHLKLGLCQSCDGLCILQQ